MRALLSKGRGREFEPRWVHQGAGWAATEESNLSVGKSTQDYRW